MIDLTIIERLKNIDVSTVDRDTLIDIRSVSVDNNLPMLEQTFDYVRKIGNPNCFKYDKMVVKTSYADTEATMEDKVESWLLSL